MGRYVIVGAGAVGTGTARELVARGHSVRIVTRSGSGPEGPGIERVAADASNEERLAELAQGADGIINCANPPYDRWDETWPPLARSILGAAERTGARLVTMSNLYGYAEGSSPMRSTDPLDPPSRKGGVRVQMWREALAAHDAGRVRVTELRASDYFGPGVGDTAHLGERVVPRALAGKSVSVVGKPDVKHSWSYIGDVCSALATLATDDRALGRAWHAPTLPPKTAREMVSALCEAGGVDPVSVRSIPTLAIRAVGLVMSELRELPEILYQFEAPFVIDASDFEATFGDSPTPLDEQLAAVIAEARGEEAEQLAA